MVPMDGLDGLVSPLILTKLRVPAARPSVIRRARLQELLARERDRELLLVCAPAGYGKTTLLAEWARSLLENGKAVAWLALDAGDSDPISFTSYLIASINHALGRVSGPITELTQIAQRIRSSPDIDLQRIVPAVINAIVMNGSPCVLVLDDYHLISSPPIHKAITSLLEHLPENLRLAIGSRSNPPLPLARMRARGQLFEVRAGMLRFKPEESDQFLNGSMQLNLSPDQLNTLTDSTEGWIAGLQLAAVSLSGRLDREQGAAREDFLNADIPLSPPNLLGPNNPLSSFSGDHRYLAEYLLEEVVDRLPEEVQAFLLATSVLERMCAPLCSAVLRAVRPDPHALQPEEAILGQLEQANLFIVPLDDQGTWYRYHHLFRDFLRAQLKKAMPERKADLHRAACHWLAANMHLREAAEQAFLTRDWEFAAAFVEQHAFTMIMHSELATLHEWCSAFPEQILQKHPLLLILQSWAWVFSFSRQYRERVEKRLQQAERVIATLADQRAASDLREHAAVVRTFLGMAPDPTADPATQLALSQEVLTHYPDGDPAQYSALLSIGYAQLALQNVQAANDALQSARQRALSGGLYFGIVESSFQLARLAHAQGQLNRAVQICIQARADIQAILPQAGHELPAVGCLEIALGCVLLEQDRLDEAQGLLQRGLDRIGWAMNPYYLMTACVALFRLHEIQGCTPEALEALARLETAWPDIAFCTQGLRAAHLLRSAPGDPHTRANALSWARTFTPENEHPPGMGPFGAAEVYYLACLAWIRVQVLTGSPGAASPTLERMLSAASAHGLETRVIELNLLQAELLALDCQAETGSSPAYAALERALSLALPKGYLRIFDQGPGTRRLLTEAARRGIYPEEVQRILAATAPGAVTQAAWPGVDVHPFQPPGDGLIEPISPRELEVLRLIARGKTNQAIAQELVISVGTVKCHINHILGKLGARNRTEAAARARALGLLVD